MSRSRSWRPATGSWCASTTTAPAAPTRRAARACAGWPTASRRSAATLRVDSPAGTGTRLEAELPIRRLGPAIWDDRCVGRCIALVTAPVRGVLAPALYVALGAATVAIVRGEPQFALAGDSATALAVELVAGGAAHRRRARGVAARQRRGRASWRCSSLTALAWPLREWNIPGAGAAFTAGLVLYAAWPALLAAAALRGPDERSLSRPARARRRLGPGGEPRRAGPRRRGGLRPARRRAARECPRQPPARRRRRDVMARPRAASGSASPPRGRRRSPRSPQSASHAHRRRAAGWPRPCSSRPRSPWRCSGATPCTASRAASCPTIPTDRALWTGEIAALALAAAGVAWGRVRARRTRAALARLVGRPRRLAAAGGLRERARGDARRPVAGARPRAATTAPAGSTAKAGRAIAAARTGPRGDADLAGGRELVAVVHRRGLLDDPALDSRDRRRRPAGARARAPARRRSAPTSRQLRASRARIVATADAERRQLERDLHDGAQQRLVTLAIGVRLARRASTRRRPGAGRRARRRRSASCAPRSADLRELAHGLFPAVLAEEGLARRSRRSPSTSRGSCPERCPRRPLPTPGRVGRLLPRRRGAAARRRRGRHGRRAAAATAASSSICRARRPSRRGPCASRIASVRWAGRCIADRARVRAELPCGS